MNVRQVEICIRMGESWGRRKDNNLQKKKVRYTQTHRVMKVLRCDHVGWGVRALPSTIVRSDRSDRVSDAFCLSQSH